MLYYEKSIGKSTIFLRETEYYDRNRTKFLLYLIQLFQKNKINMIKTSK